ncbi:response regulator transcription factor [bacterium]|nr:response regulator transcription factor [bacterium]
MARILCIEDSQEFQIYLSSILKEHNLTFVSNSNEALRITESGRDHFELILLDVSLPDGNGIKILPRLKEAMAPRFVPVMILSSDNDIITKVAAFGVGADDYVNKPPEPNELRARIDAKLRTAQSISQEKSVLEYSDLVVDLDKMTVEILMKNNKRESIELTPYEFKILKLLLSRPGQVYSREMIIDRVWGIDKFITSRTVDAHVSHLRKKLVQSQVQIETVLSAGYKLALKEKT